MNKQRGFSLILCLGLLAGTALLVSISVRAQGFTSYVAPGGDCGGAWPCYSTIQGAVDAASDGYIILVATGVYSDVHAYPRRDLVASGTVTQVVYISKSLTIRGGYAVPFTGPPDAKIHSTTLDARRQGRVLYITGDITPTIEGLRLTGGDATGLGGHTGAVDLGGIYVITATATLSNNQVFSNTAGYGGALACWYSDVTLQNNAFFSNTATYASVWGGGGGLYFNRSLATIRQNTIQDNTTHGSGGGLHLTCSTATVTGNIIAANVAQSDGGGLYFNESSAVLGANMIRDNAAGDGGGLYLWYSAAELEASSVLSNTANYGGGLFLWGRPVTLTNTVIAGNRASIAGSGLRVTASDFRLVHTTIVRNGGGDGSGIYVNGDQWWGYATASLTNTIVVSHAVGVFVRSGNTARLEATLWGAGAWSNASDWAGAGTISIGTIHIWGDPAFANPNEDDYHITSESAALDAGLNSGLVTDLDGDPRPMRLGYDIGADELPSLPDAAFTHSGPDWLGQTTAFSNTTVTSATTAYLWAFGGGMTSALENPSYTYASAGYHTVTLTATNQAGRDVFTDSVVVYGRPAAGFTAYPTEGLRPLLVVFTDTSTTIPPGDPTLAYSWDFGDGGISMAPNPTHTYWDAGTYPVTLTVANVAGSDTLVRRGYVTVKNHYVYLPVILR